LIQSLDCGGTNKTIKHTLMLQLQYKRCLFSNYCCRTGAQSCCHR